ncbi:hypothetical protein Cantr_04389 [Candida viswanathii]|uniref:Mitochondrial group I intron splicing factor CCM1 n=1 Tax=Candida viswanathii TaxID=5486 RepID=A0A367XQM8_9ASCO|nr:hypothetical protein Cantr_04389 [Candida viswanathii]
MLTRVLIPRAVLLYHPHYTVRTLSTTSALTKSFFKKFTKPKTKPKSKYKHKKGSFIIEEPKAYQDRNIQKYYNDISNYLSGGNSASLTDQLRTEFFTIRLTELLSNAEIDRDEVLEVLDLTIKNGFNKKVPVEVAALVFDKIYDEIVHKQPSFAAPVIEPLLANIEKLPNPILIKLVNFTQDSKTTKLSVILSTLQGRIDYQTFIEEYLADLDENKKLSLDVFEELVELGTTEETIPYLSKYIESLFKENSPEVHCYQNFEYSLDRIQVIINDVINKLKFNTMPVESLLTIFKLNWEILNANKSQVSSDNSDRILDYLQDKALQVKDVIFKQDLDDESLAEILLLASWKFGNKTLANQITEFVAKDDVKFLPMLRFQLEVYMIVHSNTPNVAEQIVAKIPKDADQSQAYETAIQAMMTSNIAPTSDIINELRSEMATEKSVYAYKYLIDRAVGLNDDKAALQIFNESVTELTQWAQYNNDPPVSKTLNDLIQCVVNNNPMKQAFPIFQTIKAQLQQQINIDTINAIVPKILEENLTGDVIELMTRELPKLDQELPLKFPIEKPFGYKYHQLYDTVHTYCITNTHDSTMVNNWYLYVHCYNYFFIPHERLLPTMKFFCEHQRWNGALRIFRSMLEMSKLHGEHNHKPPTKEMYLYLINEFGDKLYEEGFVEVYESMKMDISLPTQDKELLHAVMNGYCNLQEVSKVRDLFLTMSLQPKDNGGVDETSATIMIKAYTYNDLMYVEKFWNNLSTFGLVPDYNMFKQYLIAYSYHGLVDKSMEIADNIEEYDLDLTSDLLVSMHNFCYEVDGQKKLKLWAESEYPELWQEALDSGKLLEASGYKPNENFLIDGSSNDPKRLNEPIFK